MVKISAWNQRIPQRPHPPSPPHLEKNHADPIIFLQGWNNFVKENHHKICDPGGGACLSSLGKFPLSLSYLWYRTPLYKYEQSGQRPGDGKGKADASLGLKKWGVISKYNHYIALYQNKFTSSHVFTIVPVASFGAAGGTTSPSLDFACLPGKLGLPPRKFWSHFVLILV